ncbi:MAG: glycosyltransferase family 4 protein [Planctomycetes bacterium]|nr:glycosyltransferase family 4 protein [Planctomycetota bacterium]
MRLVFLTAEPESASARVRIHEHLPALAAAGLDAAVWTIPRGAAARLRTWARLREVDAVVLHRKLFDRVTLASLRRAARRLVYDLDDALYTRPHERPDGRSRRRFARVMTQADLVLAGSDYLAHAARARGAARVAVLRSGVALPPTPATPQAEPPRLVWTGSAATLPYLEALAPTLRRVHHSVGGWELDVLADQRPALAGLPVRYLPWSLEAEAQALEGAQLGLYPLPDTPWARGKCAYKVLRYMAAGLAVLAVPHGGGAEVLGDRPAGRIVPLEAWEPALCELLRDPALRRELGAHARERATHVHRLERRGAELAELLRRI